MKKLNVEKIYTAREAAVLMGVSLRTIQRAAHAIGKKKGVFGTLYFSGNELKRMAVGR